MYDETCNLIPVTKSISIIGDPLETEGTPRAVFCRVKSYSMKEKFMAETTGDRPELTIVLADKAEYNDEPIVEYKNVRYKVLGVSFDDLHDDIGLVVAKWQK